jgi:GT2 family glycosyltransferase
MVSIVVVNWNTRELIKECVAAIRENTSVPYELVLVDNGSNDGSVETIKELRDDKTRIVLLPENLGFAGGYNKGIQSATGSTVCLLNSDAFVTRGWLNSLLKCMRKTGAGMVGPWTNKAKGKQRHKPKYRLIPKIFRGHRRVEYLSFFCVIIAGDVFEKIGYLDEGFGLGTYEDDDFCRRALDAGYGLVIDGRSWVWHEAHATMKANKIDESDLLNENVALFRKKWSDK